MRVLRINAILAVMSWLAAPLVGSGFEHTMNDRSQVLRDFSKTLSKLHPVESARLIVERTGASWEPVPRLCWTYFRATPETLAKLRMTVASFPSGGETWVLFSGEERENCIGVFPGPMTFFAPMTQNTQISTSHPLPSSQVFVQARVAELEALRLHIESELGITDALPSEFDDRVLTRHGLAENPRNPMADFVETGMHVTWLVKDVGLFSADLQPTSEADRKLHFGINETEWIEIRAEALKTSGSLEAATIQEDTSKLAGFPMLSRIVEPYSDATFEVQELDQLYREALEILSRASDSQALRGLDKLVRMTQQAKKLGLGIYLLAP